MNVPDLGNLSRADVNAVQAALEERARTEWDTLDRRAVEWVCDTQDAGDLAAIVMALANDTGDGELGLRAWRLRQDYVQHRVATASEIEEQDVEQKLREEMEIE